MKRDLKSNIDTASSLIPATRTASGTGSWVDLRDYSGCVVEFGVGTMATDGTFTCQLHESVDGTALTGTVAQSDLQGTFTAYGTAAGGAPNIQRVGYIGTNRYVRAVAVFGGTGAGAITYANIIRGYPNRGPLA